MIKINNLHYTIDGNEIINDISSSFNEGEITGIIGRSGSGKSSLMRLIAGMNKSYTGEILLNDTELRSICNDKEIYKYIACLFSDSGYDIIDDTVFNFLLQSRRPFKKMLSPFTDFDVQLTEDYIKSFALNDWRDSKVLSLPGGVLKKTLLAFSFIKNSDVLLLDNPTDDLDLQSLILLQKAILRYAIDGDKLIIIAGNDVNFILQTADRIIIMERGKIDMEITPADIDAQMVNKYFDADVFISRNIYNGKPGVQQYLRDEG